MAGPKREKAFSLRVTAEDEKLIDEAVAAVCGHVGEDVAKSVVLRRALRIGLHALVDDPAAKPGEERPRKPRRA